MPFPCKLADVAIGSMVDVNEVCGDESMPENELSDIELVFAGSVGSVDMLEDATSEIGDPCGELEAILDDSAEVGPAEEPADGPAEDPEDRPADGSAEDDGLAIIELAIPPESSEDVGSIVMGMLGSCCVDVKVKLDTLQSLVRLTGVFLSCEVRIVSEKPIVPPKDGVMAEGLELVTLLVTVPRLVILPIIESVRGLLERVVDSFRLSLSNVAVSVELSVGIISPETH